MFANKLIRGLRSTLTFGPRGGRRQTARHTLGNRRLRHEPLENRQLLSVDPGWAFGVGGEFADEARDVAVDSAGDVYITGTFDGTVDLDPAGSPEGSPNIVSGHGSFAAAYSSSGQLKWGKQFTDTNARSIAVYEDNVYVAGTARAEGVFITRLDAATGSERPLNWNPTYLVTDNLYAGASCLSIDVDENGDVYMAGGFVNDVDFDSDGEFDVFITGGPGGNQVDIYALKLDPVEGVLWVNQAGQVGNEYAEDIAVDTTGKVYICGTTWQGVADPPTYFHDGPDPDPNLEVSGFSSYVAQMDADTGEFTWARGIGIAGETHAMGLDTDSAGNVYVTGWSKAGDFYFDSNPEPLFHVDLVDACKRRSESVARGG